MKREDYVTPQIEVIEIEVEDVLCQSGGGASQSNDTVNDMVKGYTI